MKMKSLLTLIISLLLINEICFSQNQETYAKFIITESSINGKDNTLYDISRSGYFVIYVSNKQIYFANVSKLNKDQSWGRVYKANVETFPETETSYKRDKISFTWNYTNSYDSKTGYATIVLDRIYKPQGIIFELGMILSNLDLLEYKGYMDGTINFENLLDQ